MEYKKIYPTRDRHIWESYEEEIMCEYTQSMEEGLDIERYEELFKEVSRLPRGIYKKQMADTIFDIVHNAPQKEGYPYNEPSDLEGIRRLRKSSNLNLPNVYTAVLADKIKGAWLGRICGCLLGKPIEGIRSKDLNLLLEESGNYPMRRYILSKDITDDIINSSGFDLKGDRCWADNISCAPADDDTNYTVLASLLIEKYGRDFTSENMMEMWMNCQPHQAYCTAERVAWRNYFEGYSIEDTAIYKNPYREWIGAQIRGDYFGYINPGNAQKAAGMAWRDGAISHIKNGIYGEMFIAAMIATAGVCNDAETIILGGLEQIPSTSRLYEKVVDVIKWHKSGVSEEECRDRIHSAFDEHTSHGWCHTISNAMIVIMGLLYGNDYSSAVGIAVQSAFDTDCNGATVGSIYGMMHGADAIGQEWTKPINGRLKTSLIGKDEYTIDELVKITINHIG
ncbi:MAG: ADP-ribosylglycohydrolase family protein [Eubacteriales bacterium]|nr:ADP-ribosylglycohydrolase family protein [Eubacteriales bacterium]